MAGHFIPFVRAAVQLKADSPTYSWRPCDCTADETSLVADVLRGGDKVGHVWTYEDARMMCHAVNYMLELMQQAGGSAECLMRAGQQQAGTEK